MTYCHRSFAVAALAASAGLFCGLNAARADIAGFGDFSGFTINHPDAGAAPTLFPAQDMIQLTNQTGGERRSIFCNTPQSITSFTASFTYRAVGNPSGAIGACLVFQNSAAGASAVGNNFNFTGYGYDGITNSTAISLELGSPTRTGLYSNGSIGGGAASTGSLNLISGNPILVTVSYNGAILHETLQDTVTLTSFETFLPVNIPAQVGGSTAFVGFTANTGNPSFSIRADQYFSHLQFGVPAPATVSMMALVGLGVVRRRRPIA